MTENKNTLKKPYTSLEYAEFAIYCNQNNLVITDFEDKLIGVEPKISITLLKNYKVDELRKNIENYFYTNYPIYKQNNIAIFGTEEEKEEFKKFHDDVVGIYDLKVRQINEVETEEQLNKIKIDEDEFEKSPF